MDFDFQLLEATMVVSQEAKRPTLIKITNKVSVERWVSPTALFTFWSGVTPLKLANPQVTSFLLS
jgi:hypothetical protein